VCTSIRALVPNLCSRTPATRRRRRGEIVRLEHDVVSVTVAREILSLVALSSQELHHAPGDAVRIAGIAGLEATGNHGLAGIDAAAPGQVAYVEDGVEDIAIVVEITAPLCCLADTERDELAGEDELFHRQVRRQQAIPLGFIAGIEELQDPVEQIAIVVQVCALIHLGCSECRDVFHQVETVGCLRGIDPGAAGDGVHVHDLVVDVSVAVEITTAVRSLGHQSSNPALGHCHRRGRAPEVPHLRPSAGEQMHHQIIDVVVAVQVDTTRALRAFGDEKGCASAGNRRGCGRAEQLRGR
jgi:hypothetical protein